jgi:hypothetical protein
MNKSTWIVGILVVILGLIYFFTKEDKASSSIKRLKLPAFVIDKIDKIEILGKDSVIMTKRDDKWLLDIGQKQSLVDADPLNIENMLLAAQGVKHSHYVTNIKEKYEDLGVGTSAITIKLYQQDQPVWSLILGNSASGSTHYAKLPDDEDVYVVKGSFWQLTRNGANDWRDRRIFPTKEMVRSITMISKETLVLEKKGEEWSLQSSIKTLPLDYKADKAALSLLAQSLISMNASDFVDEPVPLGKPLMKLIVVADNEYAIEIYSDANDYLVKRNDGRLFRITHNSFNAINKSVEDLQDLSLFTFEKKAAVGLKIRHGQEMIVVIKDKDGQWSLREPVMPPGFDFDERAVDGMLSMLSGLDGSRLPKPTDKPKNPDWQKNWLVEVEFAKDPSIHLYATPLVNDEKMLVKGNIVAVVPASRLKTLFSGINAFKKENFEFPSIDEADGFKDLPEDVKRKVLDAVGN